MMQDLSFDVDGMTCRGCTGSVQRTPGKLEGVGDVVVTLHPDIATGPADASRVPYAQIQSAITHLGHSASARPSAREDRIRS
jgi:copper chaperone CopZ